MENVLSEQAKALGFWLREDGDRILELWCNDTLVARFSQTGVEVERIEHEISRPNLN